MSGLVLGFLALKLTGHVVTNLVTPYEFHRDEFLYLAMGSHLRFWTMDFPPLIALLAQATRLLGEPSLFVVRLVPAIAGTVVLLLALLITHELGGRRTAQALVGLSILLNPLFLRSANLFQPVVLDQLWWLLGFYALVRLWNGGEPRWWLVLGAAGGLGLLCKFSIVFFGLAVLIGLLVTDRRRALRQPWPWLAILIALAVGSPSIVGQIRLGFPVLGQLENLRAVQLQRTTLGDYLMGQVLFGPMFILGVAGLIGLLVHPALKRHASVGWTALAALTLFAVFKGKPYYAGPVHPVLYAAGAVLIERIARPHLRRACIAGVAGLIAVYGLVVLPMGLPFLPPSPMARYAARLGISAAVTTNWGEVLPLPQDYADMLGWREQAEVVARAYRGLSPEEQRRTVLFGNNYGEAGALDLYGRRMGLPPVVSLAGSFYFFGPGTLPGKVLITLGVRDGLEEHCGIVEPGGRAVNEWGVPEERDVPVYLCRDPRHTLQEVWQYRARGD